MYNGLALGKMVEDGLLHFDDSIYKHVPDFPKKPFDFTLRQLAAHTAGIRSYRGKEFALNKPFSIEESLAVFKDDPLLFEPGKGYEYNTFDFVLLSVAMQNAAGIPFEAYVKENVLHPLGMVNTYTPKEVNTNPLVTKNYTKTKLGFRDAIAVNNYYKLAGGGYLSTSEDIARLGQAILEQQLLSATTYKQLLTSQIINDQKTYYGLGFEVSQNKEGYPFVGHVGSNVGAYTNLFVFPKQAVVVAILTNCTDPKIQEKLNAAIAPILESGAIT